MEGFPQEMGNLSQAQLSDVPRVKYQIGVRVAKRLIRDNTGSGGSLDSDNVTRGLLQYLNHCLAGLKKYPVSLG